MIQPPKLVNRRKELAVSFIWFDLGYTLVYMQRETTYQQALKNFGIDVPLADIEKEFHLTDKLFMREYPGFFLEPREVFMPSYLGLNLMHNGNQLNPKSMIIGCHTTE
jgi:hypothetical protein